jgi:hypothetical protein
MLDALSLGNTNPPVNCELSCVEQFNVVGGLGGNKHLYKPNFTVHRLGSPAL